jgi:hypothetical protein
MTTILDARPGGHSPPDQALPQEFLDKCHRVEIPGEYPYYQVESEHYAENGRVYTVKAIRGTNGDRTTIRAKMGHLTRYAWFFTHSPTTTNALAR